MKTIIRRLQNQKLVTALKIVSMGIGIACSLSLFYIAVNQLNINSFYPEKDQMYQVFMDAKTPSYNGRYGTIYQPVAAAMMNDLAQVEYGTCVQNAWQVPFLFDGEIVEAKTIHADSLFFKVFQHQFLMGNSETALSEINTAVVTRKYAKKMFGHTDVVGETLNMRGDRMLKITGVIADWAQNSSFKAEVIVSFETLRAEQRLYMGWNGGDSFQGYIKVYRGADAEQLQAGIPSFMAKYMDVKNLESKGYFLKFLTVPLTKAPYFNDSRLKSVTLILILLGILLLALVTFNAILLSMSQQHKMQNELYIRRLHGSSRFQIFQLLFSDAVFQFVISLVVSVFVIWLISPLVEQNFGLNLLAASTSLWFFSLLAGITVVLFLGIFVIPGQWAMRQISKKAKKVSSRNSFFADIPLAFQVGISFTLLVFFWFIFQQLLFIQKFDKGYNSTNLAYIELNNKKLFSKDRVLKNELEKIPGIVSAGLSDDVPLYGLSGNNFGLTPDESTSKNFRNLYADKDFFATLETEVKGSGFSLTGNDEKNVIVTQSVITELGFENPMNQTIYKNGGIPFKIVGVIPDIVSGTLHSEKSGIVFNCYTDPDVYSTITMRINPEMFVETIAEVQQKISAVVPNVPVQIKYYNTELMASYEYDYAIKRTVTFFAIIAALLTIAGLVGYSINSIQKRVKEIGVRKVNGASEWSLLKLLNRSFVLKTIAALVLFSPLAWYIAKIGLQNYAYRIPVSPVTIALLSVLVVLVVFITISVAVWSVVKRNPVEALRYE